MHSSIYIPAEDSFLMSNSLKKYLPKLIKKNHKLKCLEMGVGSGINLGTLNKLGIKESNILGVDINKKAVEHCRNLGFNCIYSDLFENVEGKYNLIVFNSPYLPWDKKEPKDSQLATTGGEQGSEIINNFLKQAGKYLNKNGKIFLLTSSLTKGIKWRGFKKKLLGTEKLFFEKLCILELRI